MLQSTDLGHLDVSSVGVADGVDVGVELALGVTDGLTVGLVDGVGVAVAVLDALGVGDGVVGLDWADQTNQMASTAARTIAAMATMTGQTRRFGRASISLVKLLTPSGRYSQAPDVTDALSTL